MRGQSPIPERPKNARLGAESDTRPPKPREAITKPAIPIGPLVARQMPLHETMPEMKKAKLFKLQKDFESHDPLERWKACMDLTLMIENSDAKNLEGPVGIALEAFKKENDTNVVIALLEFLVTATNKGYPLNKVLSRILLRLDGEQNAELRKSAIALLQAESHIKGKEPPLAAPLLKLLASCSPQDGKFLAELKKQMAIDTAHPTGKAACSAPFFDGRYLIVPSPAETTSEDTSELPHSASRLNSESLVMRRRVAKILISYVTDADTAREVLSILPSVLTHEAEQVRSHCIEKIKLGS
jgi:hypothetical protein